jgi:hypothetical protein
MIDSNSASSVNATSLTMCGSENFRVFHKMQSIQGGSKIMHKIMKLFICKGFFVIKCFEKKAHLHYVIFVHRLQNLNCILDQSLEEN